MCRFAGAMDSLKTMCLDLYGRGRRGGHRGHHERPRAADSPRPRLTA
jgi:hypothetical protein